MLTQKEKELIEKLGAVYNLFGEITGKEYTRDSDLAEVAIHIHALQHAVMAQAAARFFPEDFRQLGGLPKKAVNPIPDPRDSSYWHRVPTGRPGS